MTITAKQVSELRKITGAGMMDCKKSLEESKGDIEVAIDILRKRGQKVALKRADRKVNEGNVFIYTSKDHSEGIAFSLNCETEPVSKTEEFNQLGNIILETAITHKPANKENLLTVKTSLGQLVSEAIVETTAKTGEKIEISSYCYKKGEKVVAYKHGKSIAVLVVLSMKGGEEVSQAGKNIAMQVAAMKPIAIDERDIDVAILEKEKEIGIERAKKEGKPEHVLDRIALSYVKKFLEENTLLNQFFIKDNQQTVRQYLSSINKNLTVIGFERISIRR